MYIQPQNLLLDNQYSLQQKCHFMTSPIQLHKQLKMA
jgi:hypothetical protein